MYICIQVSINVVVSNKTFLSVTQACTKESNFLEYRVDAHAILTSTARQHQTNRDPR